MKVAYITNFDAQNVKMWSGTAYYIGEALKRQSLQIDYIGPLKDTLTNKIVRKCKRHYHELGGKIYLRDPEPFILRNYAHQISRKLSHRDSDIILSATVNPIAYLQTKKNIVFWADATFENVLNFYPHFSNLCRETIQSGHRMEKHAIDNSTLAIYSSDWAAQTAIKTYNADPQKVKVIPFGANIDGTRDLEEIKSLISARPKTLCKLLFMGVDWYRKGGDTAFKVAEALNNAGLPTELTVVGCQPELDGDIPDFVKHLGFISKSSTAGKQKLTNLISAAHFLILPSRADCTPIVLSEANSLGVPCLTTQVGGIPTIIQENINGNCFPLNGDIASWCKYISNIFTDYHDYEALAMSSFSEYQTRLNWESAGKSVRELLTQL